MATNGDSAQPKGSSLAKDLFEDMGRKVENMKLNGEGEPEEGEQKVVEEIESLCMNCHEDVSRPSRNNGTVVDIDGYM